MLDAIQQRVLGVLVEKQKTVPDTYPLTENALIAGCNQKSNRDPIMEVDSAEVYAALQALRESGLSARVDGGGRVTRYRHRAEEGLNLDARELAVMTELLLRGPQAPGALKARVVRFGLRAEPDEIRTILQGLADRGERPLVEQLPRLPRERDHRWGHLLGPRPQPDAAEEFGVDSEASAADWHADPAPAPVSQPVPAPRQPAVVADPELAVRVARLENEVAELRSRLDGLLGD